MITVPEQNVGLHIDNLLIVCLQFQQFDMLFHLLQRQPDASKKSSVTRKLEIMDRQHFWTEHNLIIQGAPESVPHTPAKSVSTWDRLLECPVK